MKKTSDFSIGDAVKRIQPDSPVGVVVMHDHDRGLVKVRWGQNMFEWVPPDALKLLSSSQS